MIGRLTNTSKSKESGFRVRANSVVVSYSQEPTQGERFECIGKGVEFGVRLISTSPVKKIARGSEDLIISTESGSTYKLELKPILSKEEKELFSDEN